MATQTKRTGASRRNNAHAPRLEIDETRAIDLVMKMMAIPGVSGREGPVADFIRGELRRAGIAESHVASDNVHRQSPFGGEVGNLICKLPGTERRPRRLLVAHIDTVPLCEGSRPTLRGGIVKSGNAKTALGADNRAGASALLVAALELAKRGLAHPPVTFFWPVQEEVGLNGARFVKLAHLSRPKLAFNWDGGLPSDVTLGATGAYGLEIDIEGLASHAGVHPDDGVSAIAIAGRAIADLHEQGWHGLIIKGRRRGTSNIGKVEGGGATNVVTDRLHLRAEARSHDPRFRKQIVGAFRKAFERAARSVRNRSGARGRARLRESLQYESYHLETDEPCVVEAHKALRAAGMAGNNRVANGGLDANWLTARGLPTVTLGCGQSAPHTVREQLDLAGYLQACRVALHLAMGRR
jgi:tripeptide aminopeptidase